MVFLFNHDRHVEAVLDLMHLEVLSMVAERDTPPMFKADISKLFGKLP